MAFTAQAITSSSSGNIALRFCNTEAEPIHYHRFQIEILKIKPDTNPVLEFTGSTNSNPFQHGPPWGNELRISVYNSGWGPAEEFEFMLVEPFLNELIEERQRSFAATIAPAEKVEFTIPLAALDPVSFERLFSAATEHDQRVLRQKATVDAFLDIPGLRSRTVCGLERKADFVDLKKPSRTGLHSNPREPLLFLNSVAVAWRCRNHRGKPLAGFSTLSFGSHGSQLALGPACFLLPQMPKDWCGSPPVPTPGIVFDLDAGLKTRTFPIDVTLEPKQRRQFDLTVSANQSATVQVKLLLWRTGSQWPELYHHDLYFICPMGTTPSIADAQDILDDNSANLESCARKILLIPLTMDPRYKNFPLVERD